MNVSSLPPVRGFGPDASDSGNWPVLLVRKKKVLQVSPELDVAWFGRENGVERELDDAGDPAPFQVSRRRLRLAHALFLVAFGAIIALLTWEVHTHFMGRSQSGSVLR